MACQTPKNLTGYDTFFFGVNNAGRDYTGSGFILYIIAGLAILFGVLAVILNEKLRLAFIMLTVLMLPIGLWSALDIANNTWVGQAVINMISAGFMISLIGYVAMTLYVLWDLLMQIRLKKNAINTQNLSEKGSPLYWQKKQKYVEKNPDREFR